MKLTTGILLILVIFSSKGYAESMEKYPIDSIKERDTSSLDNKKEAKARYIDISLEYGSNFTYRHQIDETTTASPYIFPSIYYHDKSGLWVSIGAYRLMTNYVDKITDTSNKTIAPDWIETDFNLGWDHKFWGNTDVSIAITYSIFNRKFPLVAQALRNTFEGYFGHDFKIINSGLRYDYSYQDFMGTIHGKRVNVPVHDNYLSWETSRDWFIDNVFKHGDEFDIGPMFTVLAGTDNFIGQFIVTRYPTSATARKYANVASQFLIQQFSLNVPVAYTIGNFTITPSYEYTLLTQKVTETSPTKYPIYRFSIAYRINFKKDIAK